MSDYDFLATLERVIKDRIENPAESSYTSELVAAGSKRIAQKVGEEGVELALAAAAGDREEILDEAADLLYHVLVLLNAKGLSLTDVVTRLEGRQSPG